MEQRKLAMNSNSHSLARLRHRTTAIWSQCLSTTAVLAARQRTAAAPTNLKLIVSVPPCLCIRRVLLSTRGLCCRGPRRTSLFLPGMV
eukprot:753820-Hanusia_phi.AAC.6